MAAACSMPSKSKHRPSRKKQNKARNFAGGDGISCRMHDAEKTCCDRDTAASSGRSAPTVIAESSQSMSRADGPTRPGTCRIIALSIKGSTGKLARADAACSELQSMVDQVDQVHAQPFSVWHVVDCGEGFWLVSERARG